MKVSNIGGQPEPLSFKRGQQINIPPNEDDYFPSTKEWDDKVRELYVASGQKCTNTTEAVLMRLGRMFAKVKDKPLLTSLDEISQKLDMGRSQINVHLKRAVKAGVIEELYRGPHGLLLRYAVSGWDFVSQADIDATFGRAPKKSD